MKHRGKGERVSREKEGGYREGRRNHTRRPGKPDSGAGWRRDDAPHQQEPASSEGRGEDEQPQSDLAASRGSPSTAPLPLSPPTLFIAAFVSAETKGARRRLAGEELAAGRAADAAAGSTTPPRGTPLFYPRRDRPLSAAPRALRSLARSYPFPCHPPPAREDRHARDCACVEDSERWGLALSVSIRFSQSHLHTPPLRCSRGILWKRIRLLVLSFHPLHPSSAALVLSPSSSTSFLSLFLHAYSRLPLAFRILVRCSPGALLSVSPSIRLCGGGAGADAEARARATSSERTDDETGAGGAEAGRGGPPPTKHGCGRQTRRRGRGSWLLALPLAAHAAEIFLVCASDRRSDKRMKAT
ncbi:hypothetical protein HPB48_016357 [Haemaphysalis longicornis]|uniref:Uncharacterized protein n=1 Tax=Haemaphysalis longicornis TaxID=44386 RepID=A0A9J6H284_HAELO|nr:hypothetical protein HPB48_016357 [Haemaphysalis longicornis]